MGMGLYIIAVVKNGKNDGGRFSAVLVATAFGLDNLLLILEIENVWQSNSLEIDPKPQWTRCPTIQAG
jgi:hypothetical protein